MLDDFLFEKHYFIDGNASLLNLASRISVSYKGGIRGLPGKFDRKADATGSFDENLVEGQQPCSFLIGSNRQVQCVTTPQTTLEILQIIGRKDVILLGRGDHLNAGLECLVVFSQRPTCQRLSQLPTSELDTNGTGEFHPGPFARYKRLRNRLECSLNPLGVLLVRTKRDDQVGIEIHHDQYFSSRILRTSLSAGVLALGIAALSALSRAKSIPGFVVLTGAS